MDDFINNYVGKAPEIKQGLYEGIVIAKPCNVEISCAILRNRIGGFTFHNIIDGSTNPVKIESFDIPLFYNNKIGVLFSLVPLLHNYQSTERSLLINVGGSHIATYKVKALTKAISELNPAITEVVETFIPTTLIEEIIDLGVYYLRVSEINELMNITASDNCLFFKDPRFTTDFSDDLYIKMGTTAIIGAAGGGKSVFFTPYSTSEIGEPDPTSVVFSYNNLAAHLLTQIQLSGAIDSMRLALLFSKEAVVAGGLSLEILELLTSLSSFMTRIKSHLFISLNPSTVKGLESADTAIAGSVTNVIVLYPYIISTGSISKGISGTISTRYRSLRNKTKFGGK